MSGLSFAKALAWAQSVPLVPVHHLAGHIESLVLQNGEMPLPAVVLVVSGGHTNLYRIEEPGRFELLGRTRDDAAGEAFDKVAKLLRLGYPGARRSIWSRDRATIARWRFHGPPDACRSQRAAPARRRDFSFSGLKTAVPPVTVRRAPSLASGRTPRCRRPRLPILAASFQRVVVETLLDQLFEPSMVPARSVGIRRRVGEQPLAEEARTRAAARRDPLYLPSPALNR